MRERGQGTTSRFQLAQNPSSSRSTQLRVESQTLSTATTQQQATVFYDQAKPPQEVKLPFLLPIKGPSSSPPRSTASSKMENLSTPYNPSDSLSHTVASSQASTSTAPPPPPQPLAPSSSLLSNVADHQSNPPSTSAPPSHPELEPLVIDPKNPRKQQSKMFRCTGFGDCQMTFTRSEHLARHVRKHTGERPFKCHCGRTFSRLDNVRQHASTVHADLVAENAKCIQDLVALHSTLSVTTMQKQKDSGMVLRDTEKEAAKAKRKAEAALRPKKSAGNPGRKKGTAAEKKAKEQADAAEAQERRREEEAKQQEQSQPRSQTPLAGPSNVKAEDTPYRLSPAPAPASFSPYPNEQQFVPPGPSHPPPSHPPPSHPPAQQEPPHLTSMSYPSYNLAPHPSSSYSQAPPSYGMYSQPPPPSGVEHLYGFQSAPPPAHHQQQEPPSPSTSAAFYSQPPPPSQSPHLEHSDSRDHQRNTSSSFHHDTNYPSHSSLGYPTSSMYPPDQNKVSLPSISALLPTPFSRPDSHIPSPSNEATTESQSQHSQQPIDAQAAYYASLNSTTSYNRSAQYGYPPQVDYAQQQSQQQQQQPQYAPTQQQQPMFPPYDPYGRPPSAGAQSERGDVPPSLSNGSSSTASSSFPADSPSNPPFQDQLGQPSLGQLNYPTFTNHYSTHPYFSAPSPWGAPPPGYNLGYPAQQPQPSSNQQQYSSIPSNYPAPQSYPPVPTKWSFPPTYGNTNYTSMQNQQQNDETAPRLTPLFASPSQPQPPPQSQSHLQSQPPHSQPHSLSQSHSRDHSNRSSLNSPVPPVSVWGTPLSGLGASTYNAPVGGGGIDHGHSQNPSNGMFATPTSLPKRGRDEQGEDFYAHKRRALYGETPLHLHIHHHHQLSHPEQMHHGLTPIGGR